MLLIGQGELGGRARIVDEQENEINPADPRQG